MRLDPMTLAYARRAVWEACRKFLFDPNVSLIDFGFPERQGVFLGDDYAVRIHVVQKLSGNALESAVSQGKTQLIPTAIGGFSTDVPKGNYYLQKVDQAVARGGGSPQSTVTPLQGGISISNEYQYTYGTLGGVVRDRSTGQPMLLSNWHVLAGSWWARRGQRVYQPGRMHGGSQRHTIAQLERDAMAENLDAAVASLLGHRSFINRQFNLGPVNGIGRASIGMQVVKSGATSGRTYGQITAIEGVTRMTYSQVPRIIRNIITIDQHHWGAQVSAPGDSGSWWLDAHNHQVVGLHFAGSNYPERALAMDISKVADALNVDIASA